MTVRKMPPGRRSISQSTVFQGAGVNHFLTCSGTVHAAQTSSGGTSTTRSNRRSRRGSNLAFMRVISLLQIFQEIVQLVEAALPKRALLDHPALRRLQRLRHQL